MPANWGLSPPAPFPLRFASGIFDPGEGEGADERAGGWPKARSPPIGNRERAARSLSLGRRVVEIRATLSLSLFYRKGIMRIACCLSKTAAFVTAT